MEDLFGEQITTSPEIDKLATAMVQMQGGVTAAPKDKANTFHGSKYADLASVVETAQGPMREAGLCVIQSPHTRLTGERVNLIGVTTTLMHTSGQWYRSTVYCQPKDLLPQSVGSAITYLRRYAYCATLGIVADDDDGNAGTFGGGAQEQRYQQQQKQPKQQPRDGQRAENWQQRAPEPPTRPNQSGAEKAKTIPPMRVVTGLDSEKWEQLDSLLKGAGIDNAGKEKAFVMKSLNLKAGKLLAELTAEEGDILLGILTAKEKEL